MHTAPLITVADPSHTAALTRLSVTTFVDAFGKDNRKEDMDKYLAEEMNETKLRGELEDAQNIFYLAWLDGKMIGYAKLRATKTPPGLEQHRPLEIERIYVLQQYHGSKIGAALMNKCITYARSHGHDVIWLGVWAENHKAVSFYKKWGFELFGSHNFKLGDDIQTDVLMKKAI